MTNGEKFKTLNERKTAFNKFCLGNVNCDSTGCSECALEWLEAEVEESKPLPCPFCECSDIRVKRQDGLAFIECARCGIRTRLITSENDAIVAWNRRAK